MKVKNKNKENPVSHRNVFLEAGSWKVAGKINKKIREIIGLTHNTVGCYGQVQGMAVDRFCKQILKRAPHGIRKRGKPRKS